MADHMQQASAEQRAREMLDRLGMPDALSMTAGDVVEIANLIAERDALAARVGVLTNPHETRADGKVVRKDRWETGIRRIVALLWGNRHEFEIDDVVDAVSKLATPHNDGDDEALFRSIAALAEPSAAPVEDAPICGKCGHREACEAMGCKRAPVGAASEATAEPVAHLCILQTKDAGATKFFTAPSDPRGFPVYTAAAIAAARAEGYAAGMDRAEEVCREVAAGYTADHDACRSNAAAERYRIRQTTADHCADALRAAKP